MIRHCFRPLIVDCIASAAVIFGASERFDSRHSSMTDAPRSWFKFDKSRKSNGLESVNKAKSKEYDTTTRLAHSPKQKKTRKRLSPFRIKDRCIVALRLNPEGNQLSKVDTEGRITPILPDASLIPVWTNPVQDRDEGLALVGKRVRCFLPKQFVEGRKSRVLEGEILAIHDYMKRHEEKPWKVDLLVDKSMLSEFPFLVRTDEDVDLSKLPTDKAKRNARLELALRGINQCSVRVRLSQPGSVDGKNALKWAIQKIVPRRLFQSTPSSNGAKGKTGTTGKRNVEESETMDTSDRGLDGGATDNQKGETRRKKRKVEQNITNYVGDRDDSADQQISNWRWIVSRYHDMLMNSDGIRSKATEAQILSTGFVGEVVKVESMPKGSSSLATVTVRRMVLPEHTVNCTSPDSGRADLFDDNDNLQNLFRIPAEELVVLSRKVQRKQGSTEGEEEEKYDDDTGVNVPIFSCTWGYSVVRNVYVQKRFCTETLEEKFPPCHRCRRPVHDVEASVECCAGNCSLVDSPRDRIFFCMDCLCFLRDSCPESLPDDSESPPCYMEFCDCFACRVRYSNDMSSLIKTNSSGRRMKDTSLSRIFRSAMENADNLDFVDFGLPDTILDSWSSMAAPSSKPVARAKTAVQKPPVKSTNGRKKNENASEKGDAEVRDTGVPGEDKEEESTTFHPSCAKHLPYEVIKSRTKASYEASAVGSQDRPRNLREFMAAVPFGVEFDSRTNQRAERAKQRRLIKGISAFSNLDLDTLASRESQLRFGRSAIHAWGVFADTDISSGDMIVEYRGEIIENTMAEKREKLYEAAKIGSDYMFRIDANFVCDATKVGNVARFINASCDPNCYTKIINVDGQKRIVIYAKKDIPTGVELCYDYKFSLEYDPAKRISCRCGAPNCRGYMNWDKKYVLVGAPDEQAVNEVKHAKNA